MTNPTLPMPLPDHARGHCCVVSRRWCTAHRADDPDEPVLNVLSSIRFGEVESGVVIKERLVGSSGREVGTPRLGRGSEGPLIAPGGKYHAQ